MNGVQITKKPTGTAAYCLNCTEYRMTQTVSLVLRERDSIKYKNAVQCMECGSRNIKEIPNISTGLESKTETP